jgi:hypothetical protein
MGCGFLYGYKRNMKYKNILAVALLDGIKYEKT